KVSAASSWDSEQEARAGGEEIEQLQRKGHTLNEMAILVRASYQMRSFEDRFVTLGLNYRVVGGLRFYERQEIRDALAYLRVTVSPDDDLAFERIMNTPRRGIGRATLEQMHRAAREGNISLTKAATQLVEAGEVKGKAGASLGALLKDFERWRGMMGSHHHAEVLEQILEDSGYRRMWKEEKTPDAQGRL